MCASSADFKCRPANSNAAAVPIVFHRYRVGWNHAHGVELFFWIGLIGRTCLPQCIDAASTIRLVDGSRW
jgi:hypothetical protein